jgi:hypothetical protein
MEKQLGVGSWKVDGVDKLKCRRELRISERLSRFTIADSRQQQKNKKFIF